MANTGGRTGTQDDAWTSKERGEEARYVHEKEHAQLSAIRARNEGTRDTAPTHVEHDFEGGFGGQEDLEDRYATTSGEH